MPARVNNPRAAEQLRREYDVQGDRLNMRVDDTVVPVAVVSDLTAGASGVPIVRRSYAAFDQAAVAAQYTVWRLEVPPGVIGIVRNVFTAAGAASRARVHFGTSFAVAPANIAPEQYMDGRLRAMNNLFPSGTLAYDTQVAPLVAPYLYIPIFLNPGDVFPVEWLLGRGDGLYDFIEFSTDVVNFGVTIVVEWDEIQAY